MSVNRFTYKCAMTVKEPVGLLTHVSRYDLVNPYMYLSRTIVLIRS